MIAKGGRLFVAASAIAAAIVLPIQMYVTVALAGFTVFLAVVFRDPKRVIGDGVVAPADGVVREVDYSKGLVSTYLALRNVHVTRAPLKGSVMQAAIQRGRHSPAFSGKSTGNERFAISMETDLGTVRMVEMVGALARRIVPYVKQGQSVFKGQRLSLIRFGSRVDLFLPPEKVKITVVKGQRLFAGVTRIGEIVNGRME